MTALLTVRALQTTDPDCAAVAAIAAAEPETLCDFEYPAVGEVRAFIDSFAATGQTLRYYLAETGGEPVGYGFLFHIPWLDEPGRYWVAVRVRPEARRRGAGRLLYSRLCADLHALGAAAARAMIREGRPEIALAERAGFREVLRTLPFTLELAGANTAALDAARARVEAQGLAIRTLAELRASDPAWLPKLFALHAALTRDVPIPTQPLPTLAWFEGFATRLPQAFFVALDGDQYIGESFLHPDAEDPRLLNQQVTGVLRSHRGRGVAMALKLATIDYAQRAGYRAIRTWVETNNASMLAINRNLGFVAGPGAILFERMEK